MARDVRAGADLWFLNTQFTSNVSHVYTLRIRVHLAAAAGTLRQARGYPSSRRASPPLDPYKFTSLYSILLGTRHTCVNNLPKVLGPT